MYHPDRWQGDKAEATKRMAEINVAYGVLGDPIKRKAYDSQSISQTSGMGDDADTVDQAFDAAMSELEARWQTAVSVLPDLSTIKQHLTKTAHRLAFTFMVIMLETKQFSNRQQIADKLEKLFLETHFGTNPEIIIFAKSLIEIGHKDAVKALNRYIDVLGSELDPSLIISRVRSEYSVYRHIAKNKNNGSVQKLQSDIIKYGYTESAIYLIEEVGLICHVFNSGMFQKPRYSIYKSKDIGINKGEIIIENVTSEELVRWVKANLC